MILKEYPRERSERTDIPYYPLLATSAQRAYEDYKQLVEQFPNLILLARLAEFKYYNMDDVIKKALNIFDDWRKYNE